MPLSILTRALDLTPPAVHVSEPGWLFAETVNLLTSTGLIVWRIPLVHDGARMFAPVLDLMKKSRVEYLVRSTVDDDAVITGKLESFVALLHPLGAEVAPSRAQSAFVEVWRDWRGGIVPARLADQLAAHVMRVAV